MIVGICGSGDDVIRSVSIFGISVLMTVYRSWNEVALSEVPREVMCSDIHMKKRKLHCHLSDIHRPLIPVPLSSSMCTSPHFTTHNLPSSLPLSLLSLPLLHPSLSLLTLHSTLPSPPPPPLFPSLSLLLSTSFTSLLSSPSLPHHCRFSATHSKAMM